MAAIYVVHSRVLREAGVSVCESDLANESGVAACPDDTSNGARFARRQQGTRQNRRDQAGGAVAAARRRVAIHRAVQNAPMAPRPMPIFSHGVRMISLRDGPSLTRVSGSPNGPIA